MLDTTNDRSYSIEQLEVLNRLRHPVWIYDFEQRSMHWANTAALEVWHAASVEDFRNRDFASGVSASTKTRFRSMIGKVFKNESVTEQWTFYPQGGEATTLGVTCSAIRIREKSIALLVEAEVLDQSKITESAVRDVEIMRHLPFAVSQYSTKGSLIYRNPEATRLFGANTSGEENNENSAQSHNNFLSLFVDANAGMSALQQVESGIDFNAEVELKTPDGPRWYSVGLRRALDPVTSDFVILFSARDISEIIKARKDTTKAALKSEFMAVMAHEIRTPLHQMIGYLDLLEGTKLYPEQLEFINQVQSSSSLLMSIINDLLDYSKLECGQVELETVDFALQGLIESSLASTKPDAEMKMLQLQCHLGDNLPVKIMGDPNRLRQILINLLSNAVKFTEAGSIRVTVSVAPTDTPETSRLRFEVTDTGIGVDPLEQDVIFEKYRQANASVARHYGGTGLGLSICKGLTELMGGSIGLQSEVGRGTTAYFEIPLQVPNQTRDNTALDPRDAVDVSMALRILVAEDNLVNQKVMRSMLGRLGHAVTIAENGQVALDELNRSSFDLVLMDVQMPVMDGIECTKQIRQALNQSISMVPVVGLTASFQNADLDFYIGIGMDACLGKPLRMEQLKQAISTNFLKSKQAMLKQACRGGE